MVSVTLTEKDLKLLQLAYEGNLTPSTGLWIYKTESYMKASLQRLVGMGLLRNAFPHFLLTPQGSLMLESRGMASGKESLLQVTERA
jgi:hypothetical protein